MPGDLWPGQVRSFVEKRDHTYRAIRVRRHGWLLSVLHIFASSVCLLVLSFMPQQSHVTAAWAHNNASHLAVCPADCATHQLARCVSSAAIHVLPMHCW